MPSSSIEALGRLISRQVAGTLTVPAPCSRTAYTLVGVQMKYFPPKNVLPARCAMQGDTARSMAAAPGPPRPGGLRQHLPPLRGAPRPEHPPGAARGAVLLSGVHGGGAGVRGGGGGAGRAGELLLLPQNPAWPGRDRRHGQAPVHPQHLPGLRRQPAHLPPAGGVLGHPPLHGGRALRPLGGERRPRWPNSSGPWRPLSRPTGDAPWRRTRCGPRWPAPGPPWRATTATCPCGRSAPSLTR